MPQRGLLPFLIVVCVCLASIALLPAGAGPYTAVYGPASAFRAQRAILLLWFALVSLVTLAAAFVGALRTLSGSFLPFAAGGAADPLMPPLSCSLRC
ncbi:MAG TPA: hypothetical protein VKG84_03730 [Candidatus Acidoferrales bacterium]|nr:hypothetical protein [Candidatus Acidoferrales bacterium]